MKTKITLFIIGILALGVLTGKAATVLQGDGGGTGKGSATSTDVGKFLRVASSSPRLIYDFGDAGGDSFWTRVGDYLYPATTTDLVGIGTTTPATPLHVIGTSTFDGNIITGGIQSIYDGVLYFDIPNTTIRAGDSTSAINYSSRILVDSGNATAIDWSTANALVFSAYSTDGILKTSSSNGTVAVATDGTDYWSPTTLTDNNQLSNGSGYLTSAVTSLSAGTNISVSNSTGTVTVSGKQLPIQWLGYYATSTTNWDDPFFFFNSTSSISKVLVGVKDGSLNGNIYYGTSQTAASSSLFKLFSSDIAITATTTPACYAVATSTACPNAINASSTPGINNVLRFTASSASTTALTATVYYAEN